MIGVRADGRKELVSLADGCRESAESWADLLRDCKRRGMHGPVLAVGEFHKTANVLAALPKAAHPVAKKALAEIWNAEDNDHARGAVKAFAADYGAKFPKAVAKVTQDEPRIQATALAMAFKLIESAQRRWRMVNAPHLVALVRARSDLR